MIGLPSDYDHEKVGAEIEGEELLDDFYGSYKRHMTPQQVASDQISKLNKDQLNAFEMIAESLLKKPSNSRGLPLFFVEGSGGCGMQIVFFLIKY